MNKSTAILTVILSAFCASAALKTAADYDVGDYVQDGLVAHYDGIRNAGANLPHDANAAQWADLASNGAYAYSVSVPVTGDYDRGGWISNAWRTAGFAGMQMSRPIVLGSNFTIQVVGDFDLDSLRASGEGRTYPVMFTCATDDHLSIFMNRSYAGAIAATNLIWKNDIYSSAGTSSGRPYFTLFNGKYVNASFDFSTHKAYITDNASFSSSRGVKVLKADASVEGLTYCWGARTDAGLKKVETGMAGLYHAVRIYSRKLGDDELAWNMAVDECRFRGGNIPCTNVVVAASAIAALRGAENPDVYVVVGSHTFTASPATNNGITYSATGYTVETWNGSSWDAPVTMTGNSYTYTVGENSPKVRLTWLWEATAGIRTASDYDVSDYIQGGLIANYDGIRNVAADAAHDPSASFWNDIKGGNRMEFKGTNSTAAASGSWTGGNSYSFAFSYAHMESAIDLGTNITVQLALDADFDAQTAAYAASGNTRSTWPTYFSLLNDSGVFCRPGTRHNLEWKNNTWCGTRVYFSNWEGQYMNAVVTADNSYLGQSTTRETETQRTTVQPFNGLRWTIGGAHYSNNSTIDIDRRLTLSRYYSARFYNRPLTNEELAWNRKVDEIRFHGAVYTNVVVASSKAEAQGVQPNGVYEVIAEGTFTAEPVPALKDGAHFTYVPRGYTVERLVNGVWSAPEAHEGSSYTYNVQSENGAIVRLTWKWRADGLGLFFMVQ